MMSKDYLTNSCILFEYLELVFLQQQLVKFNVNSLPFNQVTKAKKRVSFILKTV